MSLVESALLNLRAKRSLRIEQAQNQSKEPEFATYEGKSLIDGTDIVRVGSNDPVSGFRVISNAPLSIGEKVSLRPNQVGGLQRVDARNRPIEEEVITETQEEFGIVYAFANGQSILSGDNLIGIQSSVLNLFNGSVTQFKNSSIGVTTVPNTAYTINSELYTSYRKGQSATISLTLISPISATNKFLYGQLFFSIPKKSKSLFAKIERKVGKADIDTGVTLNYNDSKCPISLNATSINSYEFAILETNTVTITRSFDGGITIATEALRPPLDISPSNYTFKAKWSFKV